MKAVFGRLTNNKSNKCKERKEWPYVGESNEIAHLLDSQIATNTSTSMKKNFPQKNQIFIAF